MIGGVEMIGMIGGVGIVDKKPGLERTLVEKSGRMFPTGKMRLKA